MKMRREAIRNKQTASEINEFLLLFNFKIIFEN